MSLNLWTLNNLVSWMPESTCFRTLFWSQQVNRCKTLLKCTRWCFYATFRWISDKSSTQTSLLVRSEILGLCFNRLTGGHIYSNLHREIFLQLVPTQLSWKQKTFSEIFIAFFKSIWSFHHLQKKRWPSYLKYLWSYWHQRMWFLECLKAPSSEHSSELNELTSRNTAKMCTSVLLCYFSMNIRKIEHANISLIQIRNLGSVF